MSTPRHLQDVLLAEHGGQTLPRWELPRFDAPPPEPLPEPPTAEEIASIESAAHEEGFERGQKDGYAAGYQAGEQPLLEQATRLKSLIAHIARPLQQLDDEVEQALIDVVAGVAERVIGDELSTQPQHIKQMLQDVLKGLPAQLRTVRVQVHPDDAALLNGQFQPEQDVTEFIVIADDSLQRGDCRVTTESSFIDGRWKARLAEVLHNIREEGGG